ncbi:aspartate/glutamate racemase family protein [Streptomyces sp. SID1034]|uniref:aspartate/glutamate racemase family protein n=1 Tax=Streptomyces sp. SID1034 TaxID=2690248 RepID=UPI00136F88AB|nr:aspartate/glutamate racemase family protein [Streptomyces sp. SID1034]MYV96179.1 hypothetical protein [Streptomyces sp. SID1034]
MTGPRIALISAVAGAMAPAAEALGAGFPEAELWHLLDDRLLSDADGPAGLSGPLRARMRRLVEHAVAGGADAVLLTCSLYGVVAQELDPVSAVPVLAPDRAAFERLATGGHQHVLVIASLEAALQDSTDRLRATLARRAPEAGTRVSGVVVPGALTAAGDIEDLVRVLAAAASGPAATADAVFLAQYSLAPAARALAVALGVPVVSGPTSAAHALRALLKGD